jgi:hypothetical protein
MISKVLAAHAVSDMQGRAQGVVVGIGYQNE